MIKKENNLRNTKNQIFNKISLFLILFKYKIKIKKSPPPEVNIRLESENIINKKLLEIQKENKMKIKINNKINESKGESLSLVKKVFSLNQFSKIGFAFLFVFCFSLLSFFLNSNLVLAVDTTPATVGLTYTSNPAKIGTNTITATYSEPISSAPTVSVNQPGSTDVTNAGMTKSVSPWTQRNISGQHAWYSIASSSDGTKLAAGVLAGYIYTSTDSGVTWTERTTSGQRYWYSIASSSDGTKLAAVNTGGYIYTSIDSGATWTQRTTSGARQWVSITSSSDGTKLAAAQIGGYIYTSIDSGATWAQRTTSGARGWRSISSSSDGVKLFGVVYNGYIYTSTDSGATWTERTTSGSRTWLLVSSSSDGTKLVAAELGGWIYTSIDSGATWIQQTTLGQHLWYSITSSSDGTKLVAVENSGYIYTSADSGATWTERTTSGSRGWQSISSSSDGTKLAAVVNGGYIYTSTDSGATWTQKITFGGRAWYSIASSSDGTKLAAVDNYYGYIYTSTDSGATWVERTSSGLYLWSSITSSSDGTKLAAVSNGHIHTSTDSGATWTEQTNSGQRNWSSITSSSDGTKLTATVSDGYIYTSTDSGATWTEQTNSGQRNWSSITSSSDGTKLAAVDSNYGYIYTSTDSGATWTERTTSGSHNWQSITSSSDGTKLAAVGSNDFINTSNDSGVTWTQQNNSGYNNWYSITSSADGTKLAAVNSGGYIYTSIDSGVTWTEQTSAGSRNWKSITSSFDGTKLVAVSYDGYIYTLAETNSYSYNYIVNTANGSTYIDGTATVSLSTTTDLAGNTSSAPTNNSFAIDTTAPAVALTYTRNTTGAGVQTVTATYSEVITGTPTVSINQPGSTDILNAGMTKVTDTWIQRTTSGSRNWKSIASSSDGTKLVAGVGDAGNIDYINTSTDSGATWTERTSSGLRSWLSIASSANGTKLAAVEENGYIYTSTDSGVTWIERTGAGSRFWQSIASSADGTKLVAGAWNGGYIYTSTDSGVNWIERTSSGVRNWKSITSSSDGTKLAASAFDDYIYTSSDSGATWIERTGSGSRYWGSITSSSDGTKLAAVNYTGYIYTSTDSGATWIERNPAESGWMSITSSSDGTKLFAIQNGGYIYTSTDSGITWIPLISAGLHNWTTITSSSDSTKLAVVAYGGYIYTFADTNSYSYNYTVNLTNGTTYIDGTATVSLSSVTDTAGNTSSAPTNNTFEISTVGATVALTYSANEAKAGVNTITATYSKAISSAPNISINQPGSTDITSVAMTGSGTTYSYAYTVNQANGSTYIDGTATVSLSATTDSLGNTSSAPTNTTFAIDTTSPTGTIDIICDIIGNRCTTSGKLASPQQIFSVQTLTGTALDNVGGLGLTTGKISLLDTTTSKYFNGTAFTSDTPVLLDTTGTTTWSYNVPSTPFTIGDSYTLTFTSYDIAGNAQSTPSTLSFNFINSTLDVTAPVITLNGANPMPVTRDGTYTEPGATALDAVDGVVSVVTTGTVNTSALGAYTITYTAVDQAGNLATLTRVVNVTLATTYDIVSTPITSVSIGQSYGGGKVAYILQPGDTDYVEGQVSGIIAAETDQSTGAVWGCNAVDLPGAAGIVVGTGSQNTTDIIGGCATTGIAARVANAYNGGGFSDWYLPSKDELHKLYLSKDLIGNFSTGFGVYYWSSTEVDDYFVELEGFADGEQGSMSKAFSGNVRAIRSFTIPSSTGTISPSGTTAVVSGANQTYTITPSSGYRIETLTVDGASLAPVGTYTFTNVTTTHTIATTFALVDIIAPVITLNGDNPMSITRDGTYTEPGATALDAVDGVRTVIISGTVNTAALGAYTITYTATDASGNIGTATRTVNVVLPPTFNISASTGENGTISPLGITAVAASSNQEYIITPDAGYGVDVLTVDGVRLSSATSFTFVNVTTTHTISVTFSLVPDVTAPVITVLGDNPLTVVIGETFTDPGVTAVDNIDGNILSSVVTTGTVNTLAIGTYTITYTVKDTALNTTTSTRTVNVVYAPTYEITSTAGAHGTISPLGITAVPSTTDQTYTITPDADYVVSSLLVDGVSLEKNTSHTFTNVISAHTIAVTFSPTDALPPILTVLGDNPMSVNIGEVFVDPGATAVMAVTGEVVEVITTGTVNTSVASTGNTITYSATDTNGNTTTATRTVNVNDNMPPVITEVNVPVMTSTVAVVTWTTNEPTTSQVFYGTTSGELTRVTVIDPTLSVYHVVTLSASTLDEMGNSNALVANTKYFYRVKSIDATGNESLYPIEPEENDFTTDTGITTITIHTSTNYPLNENTSTFIPDVTAPKISDVKVSDVTAFGAVVNFTVDEETMSFAEYGTSKNYGENSANNKWTKQHMIKLRGLNFGTDYHIKVTAVDRAGNETSTEDQVFKTKFFSENAADLTKIDNIEQFQKEIESTIESILPALVPPFIEEPKMINVTEDSATVTFRTNIKAYPVIGYVEDSKYDPKMTNPYLIETSDTTSKSFEHELMLLNLKPNTKYHLQSRAFSLPQVIGKSKEITFTTKASKIHGSIIDVKKDAFTVVWTTDETTTSIVEYKNLATGRIARLVDGAQNTSHSMKVENLSPGTSYEITISGLNSKGNIVEGGTPLGVRTSVDIIAPTISNIKVESSLVVGRTDKAQTIISWQTDEPSTSTVYYEEGAGLADAALSNKQEDTELTRNHVVLLSSLRAGAIYRFTIESIDNANNVTKPPIRTIITPKKAESIFDVIFKNFNDAFNFMNNVR